MHIYRTIRFTLRLGVLARFAASKSIHPHSDAKRLILAGSQNQDYYAYATIITCYDSRVPVEASPDKAVKGVSCKKDWLQRSMALTTRAVDCLLSGIRCSIFPSCYNDGVIDSMSAPAHNAA